MMLFRLVTVFVSATVCTVIALGQERSASSDSAASGLAATDDPDLSGAAFHPVAGVVGVALPRNSKPEPRVNWPGAIKESLYFLSIQHAFRLATEPGTRAELKGPFFKDWMESIRGYDGWKDGDPALVNYVGHPMMGSVSGRIYLQNERDGKSQTFGRSKAYWHSRLRAMLFTAAYSTMFELGPISEASIGNVGKNARTSGVVDLVVTPTIGTGWLIAEDIVDRYIIDRLERRVKNRVAKIFLRGIFNPSRSFASALGGHEPWIRYDRGGVWYPPSTGAANARIP